MEINKKAVCNLSGTHQHAECRYQGHSVNHGHVPQRVHAVFQEQVVEAVVEQGGMDNAMASAEGIVESPGPAVAPVVQKRRTVKARMGKMRLKPGGPCTPCSVTGTLASHLYLQRPCHTQHCTTCPPQPPSSSSANDSLKLPTTTGG